MIVDTSEKTDSPGKKNGKKFGIFFEPNEMSNAERFIVKTSL